ncbi:MAG: MGH1-like glycoside hydrolase domain-containing protein, partial [Terriglobales bacterium]
EMKRTNWKEFAAVEPLLDSLALFLTYYRQHRLDRCGLYFWRNVLESGVDNNYALLSPLEAMQDEDQTSVTYPDGLLLAVDLNSYLYAEFKAFSELCGHNGARKELEAEYAQLADTLAEHIEGMLWDEELGLYVNVNPGTGTRVRLRSWIGILPVLCGIASEERANRVYCENVLNETHFLQPFGVASMAASEPLANQAPRGLYGLAIVCNWNGPVWVLPNVLVARDLAKRGRIKEAREVARRTVAAMVKDLKKNGVLHENYRADTGESLWAPQFMSWNVLALELCRMLQPGNGLHRRTGSGTGRGACELPVISRPSRSASNRR